MLVPEIAVLSTAGGAVVTHRNKASHGKINATLAP